MKTLRSSGQPCVRFCRVTGIIVAFGFFMLKKTEYWGVKKYIYNSTDNLAQDKK